MKAFFGSNCRIHCQALGATGHPAPRLVARLKNYAGAVIFAVSATIAPFAVHGSEPLAMSVMAQNFESTRFASSTYAATMEIGRVGEISRTRGLRGVTKLRDDGATNAQVVLFTSPADLNGTATLTVNRLKGEDDLWIYLPALKKIRRLVSSNKRDSYVGSEFSFGDILGFEPEEWAHSLLPDANIQGEQCWVVESVPASEKIKKDYGYSKRISWIRKSNYVLKQGEYFDLAGQPLKRVTFEAVTMFKGKVTRFQPMLVRVENEQTKRMSSIHFTSFEANVTVSDDAVSPRALEQ